MTVCRSLSVAGAPPASPRGAARVRCGYSVAALARVAMVEQYRACSRAVQTGADFVPMETLAGCPVEQAAVPCFVAEPALPA